MGLEEKIASSAYLYDVIVIGGGIAAYSCALNAKAWGMKVAFIEQLVPGGVVGKYQNIKDYLGFNKIKGKDLVLKMFEQLQTNGVEYLYGNVVSLSQRDGYQVIDTEDKLTRYAKAVILATGVKELDLEIEGFNICKNSIFTDVTQLFFNVKNKNIVLFGNNKTIIDYAILLSTEAKQVTVINPFNDFEKSFSSLLESYENIIFYPNATINRINGNDKKIENIVIQDLDSQANETIITDFIYLGFNNFGNSEFIDNKKILTTSGMIEVDQNFATKIPGLYATGSITNIENNFMTTNETIGSASIAAFNACKYIKTKWK